MTAVEEDALGGVVIRFQDASRGRALIYQDMIFFEDDPHFTDGRLAVRKASTKAGSKVRISVRCATGSPCSNARDFGVSVSSARLRSSADVCLTIRPASTMRVVSSAAVCDAIRS